MQQAEITSEDHQQKRSTLRLIVAIFLAALAVGGLGFSRKALAALHGVHFHCNFTPKQRSQWQFPHPEDWEIKTEGAVHYLHMVRPRDPGVPRRPLQFALLKNVNVGSFDLHVKARRKQHSLIIVFNYVDTMHFYYTHISGDQNVSNHNGIFIVNGAPRKQMAGFGAKPALPDMNWHTMRVVRNVRTGKIDVYTDVQQTPIFSWVDKTFQCGQIGLGSFDEIGDFTDLDLRSSDGGCTPSAANSAELLLQRPQFQP